MRCDVTFPVRVCADEHLARLQVEHLYISATAPIVHRKFYVIDAG